MKMKNINDSFLNSDDFYEGPSDEELKRIENDLDQYSD